MSVSLAQLQRLKRQAGHRGVAPAAAATVAVAPRQASLDDLRRLLRVRAPERVARPLDADRGLPGVEVAPSVRLLERRLPMEPAPAEIDGAFARRDAIARDRLLFFDTETTGLSGGTGTRAFMIGAADWQGDALRIRQLYLTATAGEADMLALFRQWLRPDTVLSSYNGKCYDAPLLATRYRLFRMDNPLAGLAHVDLLHPTRRRFRGVWENCRLATIERNRLLIVREDDLPGAQAPAAWLHYLRGGSAHDLRRVVAHNHQDVVTLARLLLDLSQGEAGKVA